MMKKHIPNIITLARIVLASSLLFVSPLGVAFVVIYLLCGFSDILDGYIARRTHTESALGSRLDSAADFVMIAVIVVVLFPIIKPSIGVALWVMGIAVIRFAAVAVVWVKYGVPASLHTYANKITGLLLFLLPLSLAIVHPRVPVYVVCGVATVSAVEELLIDIFSRTLCTDRKSIFTKISTKNKM